MINYYYAVYNGYNPGIYNTWDECNKQIYKYNNAKFKKFINKSDAEYYLKYGKLKILKPVKLDNFFIIKSISKKTSDPNTYLEENTNSDPNTYLEENTNSDPNTNKILKTNTIYVYTDGSCINNGKKNAKAGIGIYFGKDDIRNVTEKVIGKQTNNIAELSAIKKVYFILKKEIERGDKIIIYSDSKYGIRCCTSYGSRLNSQGWVDKKKIPNLNLVKESYLLYYNKSNVIFKHIMAHTGKQDIHSIGNDNADRLANEAIGIINKNNKIYLNVQYHQKDEAKTYGAKWDRNKKKWFIMDDTPNKDAIIKMY